MEKYLLIVRENLAKIGALSDEERFASGPDMMPWVNSIIEKGKYITGSPVTGWGSYVSQNGVNSEGDFLTNSEGISGFDIIWAESLEDATAIARDCPMVKCGHCVREVRKFIALPE